MAYDSFDISVQPTQPFLALEYSTEYRRKEFEQNVEKYEHDLEIPYYLRVFPHDAKFDLFRLANGKYVAVRTNAVGRVAVPELELEVGLREGWVRFWFRGELLPLPAELLKERNAVRDQLSAARQQLQAAGDLQRVAEHRATLAEAEIARLREELARAKGQT